MFRKLPYVLFALLLSFSFNCFAYDDGNDEPSEEQEPRGQYRWIEMRDGSYRQVFVPDQSVEDNKETVKDEKVKDDDGEKRMTRKEWEEYERKNKKNKGRS